MNGRLLNLVCIGTEPHPTLQHSSAIGMNHLLSHATTIAEPICGKHRKRADRIDRAMSRASSISETRSRRPRTIRWRERKSDGTAEPIVERLTGACRNPWLGTTQTQGKKSLAEASMPHDATQCQTAQPRWLRVQVRSDVNEPTTTPMNE